MCTTQWNLDFRKISTCKFTYTVLHILRNVLFWAGNIKIWTHPCYPRNFDRFSWECSKKKHSKWQTRKFQGLVLGFIELIEGRPDRLSHINLLCINQYRLLIQGPIPEIFTIFFDNWWFWKKKNLCVGNFEKIIICATQSTFFCSRFTSCYNITLS